MSFEELVTNYTKSVKAATEKALVRKEATPVIRLFVKEQTVKGETIKTRPAKTFSEKLGSVEIDDKKDATKVKKYFDEICDCTTVIKRTMRKNQQFTWKDIKNDPDKWYKVCTQVSKKIMNFNNKTKNMYINKKENGDNDPLKILRDEFSTCITFIKMYGTTDAYKRRTEMKQAYDNVLKNIEKGLVNDISTLKSTNDKTLNKSTASNTNICLLQLAIKTLIKYTVYGGESTVEYENIGQPMTDLIINEKFENDEAIAKVLTYVGSKALELVKKLEGYLSEKKVQNLTIQISSLFNKAARSLDTNMKKE